MAKKKKKSKAKKITPPSKVQESWPKLRKARDHAANLKWFLQDWLFWRRDLVLGGAVGFVVGVAVDHFLIK